jgi:hypothetical protein
MFVIARGHAAPRFSRAPDNRRGALPERNIVTLHVTQFPT